MRLALLLLASGCTQILGVHDFEAAAPDATARTCRGARWRWCTTDALPAPRTLADAVDTDDATCADTLEDGTPVCLIASTTLTVSKLRVHGAKPLVLVADTITIAGVLDASGHDRMTGPGSDPVACEPATPGWNDDRTHLAGSGGGAGGSFGAQGGRGGDPSPAQFSSIIEGGGVPASTMVLHGLYGGCPGSAGGYAKSQGQAGAGHGGGAVLVIASTLELDGAIDVGGGGGAGGPAEMGSLNAYLSSGGGGGGAGGLIALEIGALTGNGGAFANGGGGGGGGKVTFTGNYTSGDRGADSGEDANVCALGGNGISGGAGGCGTMPARDGVGNGSFDALNFGSGGGGGGSVGIILSTVPLANASPPAEMM